MKSYWKHVFVLGSIVTFLVIGYCGALDFVSQYILFEHEDGNGTTALASWQSNTYRFNQTEHHNDSTTEAPNITLFITCVSLTHGRLGNKMFRYASLLGLARAQGRQLIVPPGSDLQHTFKLSYVGNIDKSIKWVNFTESKCFDFDKKLLHLPKKHFKINGYLLSYKYFDSISKEVKREFSFQNDVSKAADEILHDLAEKYKGALFVGVHVRRGDFTAKTTREYERFETPKSYFMKAFNWMRSHFPKRTMMFLVASDDFNWCQRNLNGSDVVALPGASPAVHMAVLSKCGHMILSFGTYSWWSAWLSSGHVIYFTGFIERKILLGRLFTREKFYPPNWIGLGE